jgi:hypothetical protein
MKYTFILLVFVILFSFLFHLKRIFSKEEKKVFYLILHSIINAYFAKHN